VGEDGPTHHGVFDIAYLRHMPRMAIFAPSDETELSGMLKTALARKGPTAIRYPRGNVREECVLEGEPVPLGKARVLRRGKDVAIFGLGSMLLPVLQAAEQLRRQGIHAMVIDPRCVKPLDEEVILKAAAGCRNLVTVEDHVLAGGFGSAVMETLQEHRKPSGQVLRLGFPDAFVEHGLREELLAKYGLDAEGIAKSVRRLLAGKNQPAAKRRPAAKRKK
ncbi:1-deoxy-D-xylulose-5-phosphate synthase, partial [candidate division FCPU426 bacterium]|nr:1-deoxy-D-xylulose-5-phosphate synthase [candidate division FCPU426 bacterium]